MPKILGILKPAFTRKAYYYYRAMPLNSTVIDLNSVS